MPGPKCIVSTCQKVRKSPKDPIAYHKIPRHPELKGIWLKKIGVDDPNLEYGFICSRHFNTDDYIRDLQAELLGYKGRRKLKPNAVPSLNLPFERNEISPEEKERREKEQHKKLIQDCLNSSTQQKSILSFDLFKKARYSNNRVRRGRKPGIEPSQSQWEESDNTREFLLKIKESSPIISVTLPSGEEHFVKVEPLKEEPPLDLVEEEDSNFGIDLEESEDMPAESETMEEGTVDDPTFLKQRVKKLEDQVEQQKKMICTLRRQIIREKKMMEKIVLAANSGKSLPVANKRKFYDERAKSALLKIYSLAPNLYSRFSKALNLPSKGVLASWDSSTLALTQDSPEKEAIETNEDDFQEQDYVEEEYVIQTDEYLPD